VSYHDLPLLKAPVWTWEIPLYFFVGGAAGASSVLGFAAQLTTDDEDLVRDARRIAAIGAIVSGPLLISDLGRPERFLNMLRVFKPQSPMSVGAWTVAAFGGATAAAAFAPWKPVRTVAAAGAAATGLVMATYTGVLLGVTAIPVWAENARLLPVHFSASALGSAVSLLELRGHKVPALNALGIGASVFETAAHSGASKWADALSGPVPLALRLFGKRRLAAVSTLIGSVLTRYAWVDAGKRSARNAADALTPKRSGSPTSDPAATAATAAPPSQSRSLP
jgi:DMSO reductase anchor subunit